MKDKIIVFGSKTCSNCIPHYEKVKKICNSSQIEVEYRDISENSPLARKAVKAKSIPITFRLNDFGEIRKSIVGAPAKLSEIKERLGV